MQTPIVDSAVYVTHSCEVVSLYKVSCHIPGWCSIDYSCDIVPWHTWMDTSVDLIYTYRYINWRSNIENNTCSYQKIMHTSNTTYLGTTARRTRAHIIIVHIQYPVRCSKPCIWTYIGIAFCMSKIKIKMIEDEYKLTLKD